MKNQSTKGGLGSCRGKQPQGLGAREESELGGVDKTHRFLGGGVVLQGRADDPQRLQFDVIRGSGEETLQRLPHAELFEI